MILGVNAFNISAGGGLTHLFELLKAVDPREYAFEKIILWAPSAVLAVIEDRPWLQKAGDPLLDKGLGLRFYWHFCRFPDCVVAAGCNVVFIPGGGYSRFKPFVTMSQNLLPFEWQEARRFGVSTLTLKFIALRLWQKIAFRKADGVVFLTEYAQKAVFHVTGRLGGKIAIVPHGISQDFRLPFDASAIAAEYSAERPCRILYVSIVDVYKHQWQVVTAVAKMRSNGIPVTLTLVGPPASGSRYLDRALHVHDPKGAFISYRGHVPYAELPKVYAEADIFVFASSCENMPNILLEAMATGLPIACSDRGPMPEVLGDAGEYFNPEEPDEIALALIRYVLSPELRQEKAHKAITRSNGYTWLRTARETFSFLSEIGVSKKL